MAEKLPILLLPMKATHTQPNNQRGGSQKKKKIQKEVKKKSELKGMKTDFPWKLG